MQDERALMSAVQNFDFYFGGSPRRIIGGPYRVKPPEFFGIKMAKEIAMPCDVDIPTVDFSVPDEKDLDNGIRASLIAIARKVPIYCGCAGGIGRTGLFFGALMTLLGEDEAVKYVRDNYKSHAIETKEQQALVMDYTPSLKTKMTLAVAKAVSLFY